MLRVRVVVMCCASVRLLYELQADGEQRAVGGAVAEHREPQLPADNVRAFGNELA
jgi:hypothetical protein